MSDAHDVDAISKVPPDQVFLIPMGAPIPGELSSVKMMSGSLYERLGPIAVPTDAWVLVPIETMELHDVASVWERVVAAKHVAYLQGLPGTVSDSLFEHVAVTLGIRPMHWEDVSADMIEAIKAKQRATALPPDLGGEEDGQSPTGDGIEPHPAALPTLKARHAPAVTTTPPVPPTATDDDED